MGEDLTTMLRSSNPVTEAAAYDPAAQRRLVDRAMGAPVADSVSGRPRIRRALSAAATVAALAAAATVWGNVHSAPVATAGIQLTRDGSDYVVRITEPERDSRELTAALKAQGLDIEVATVPVSPSLVGSIVAEGSTGGSAALQALSPEPCLALRGCEVGFRAPVGFTGDWSVSVGRRARPREDYASTASSFSPGERLACSPLLGQPVPDVVAALHGLGLTLEYRGAPNDSQDPTDYTGMLVEDVSPLSKDHVVVFARTGPLLDLRKPDGC